MVEEKTSSRFATIRRIFHFVFEWGDSHYYYLMKIQYNFLLLLFLIII
jgi:hypothetical protein